MILYAVTILTILATGGAYVLLSRLRPSLELEVTAAEFVLVTIVATLIFLPLFQYWGPEAGQIEATKGYKEFWNGSMVTAEQEQIPCRRDGYCVNTYRCDPYQVLEYYTETEYAGTDSKGNAQYRTVTKSRWVTEYHSCPETTEEWTYTIIDSFDRKTVIASHIYSAHPQAWRNGHGISPDVPRGIPARWQKAKDRLMSMDAEPVTKVNTYANYILPSTTKIIKEYSGSIDKYKKLRLIPSHTQNYSEPLYDYNFQAKKVSLVGGVKINEPLWQDRLMRFNAALGTELKGDMHIVFVPADKVESPEDYTNAIVAVWQGELGKWSLPKNTIALIIGTKDDKIVWSRAKTGMPEGNGALLSALGNDLAGQSTDPDLILGKIVGHANKYTHSTGIVDELVFKTFPFQRACMNCGDKDDKGTGYVYLKSSIPIPFIAYFRVFIITWILTLFLWFAASIFDLNGTIRQLTKEDNS